jgi:hypothetical protein
VSEYLVEADNQEREALAIRRLLALDHKLTPIMKSLGLPLFSWYIVDIKQERLVNSCSGDVDVLAGKLAWGDKNQAEALLAETQKHNPDFPAIICAQIATLELVKNGGLQWPPPTDYLVGIEAKCAFNRNPKASEITPDDIKAGKTSPEKQRGIGQEIDKLLAMGFNKVALFEFIANPPVTSHIDGQAWLTANAIAATSAEAMSKKKMHSNSSVHTTGVLQGRLPVNSPAGHWLIPMGAIDGADERYRGAGVSTELRRANDNQSLNASDVVDRRQEMEKSLSAILGSFPVPRSLPVVFVCCRIWRKMYRYIPFEDVCVLKGVTV